MPSEDLTKRRIRPGSAAFAAMSKERKARLLAGEPVREGGVVYIIPSPPGKSMSAKKRAARLKTMRPKKPEGAGKLTTTRDSELQKEKLKNE